MALKPISPEEIERRQDELKARFMPGANASTEVINQDVLARLAQMGEFEYPQGSGKWYSVPRVPFYEGMRINDIFQRISRAKDSPQLALVGVFDVYLREVLDIAWNKLVVPKRRRTRILKRLRLIPNPFRKASEAEIAELIAFFLVRRMASNVKFPYPTSR
jgi:hypothetical protein